MPTMLHKSPKTLSNIFSTCKLPSPLRVIHERVEAEAKRLLLYSNKSAKEIADILGFEDQASFSRFFQKYDRTERRTVQKYGRREELTSHTASIAISDGMRKHDLCSQKVKPIKRQQHEREIYRFAHLQHPV